MRQDSVFVNPTVTIAGNDSAVTRPSKPQTPYQVLRLLPKDATPAQQDSAIQAWFTPDEIHYSQQPDTLHLPGEDIPRDMKAVDLPQYYRENYFSNDSLYHPELNGERFGVAGDPVPETLHNDSLITGLLLLCFLLITFTFSRISDFIIRQTKNFFYTQKGEHSITETGNEIKLQVIFIGITSIVYALLYYLYTINFVADTFNVPTEYALLGIFFGCFTAFFALRFLLYTIVNTIMFDGSRNKKFLTSILFVSAVEGVMLYPAVLLMTYFQFPIQNVIYYCTFVLIFIKILTFYKTYAIFFRQNEFYVQIILYFCALEIVPLFALWGGLVLIVNQLRVIF